MKILITGASGLIGKVLSKSLAETHDVICMSRTNPQLNLRWIKGDVSSFEDLRQLDHDKIETVVHLAAVTGSGSEYDCIRVNALGTRNLMRYLIDKGCRKFVMASSIAAVGLQDINFRPIKLPIPDEHPCLDAYGYGFSKYLMEEITKFYYRQNPEIDVINLRLAVVCPDDSLLPKLKANEPIREWTVASMTTMSLSEAVRVFTLAIESNHKVGVRIMNACPNQAWVAVPVREILKNWWGNEIDLSYYNNPENEYSSVFDVDLIEKELGFIAPAI